MSYQHTINELAGIVTNLEKRLRDAKWTLVDARNAQARAQDRSGDPPTKDFPTESDHLEAKPNRIKPWDTRYTHTDDDIWGRINGLIAIVNELASDAELESNRLDGLEVSFKTLASHGMIKDLLDRLGTLEHRFRAHGFHLPARPEPIP